jgi:predicted nucleic acid-binding protein
LELANAFLVAERRGRIEPGDVSRLAKFVLALPIAVDPGARRRPVDSIHRLGRSHGLSSYDAAYLELAVRYGIPIATLDSDLRVAAEAEGVGVLTIEG